MNQSNSEEPLPQRENTLEVASSFDGPSSIEAPADDFTLTSQVNSELVQTSLRKRKTKRQESRTKKEAEDKMIPPRKDISVKTIVGSLPEKSKVSSDVSRATEEENSSSFKVDIPTEETKLSTIDKDHPQPDEIIHDDDDDDDASVVNVPCGGKWRERHFEFDLDVSALQERAAEQAERLAEQANRVAEQAGRVAAKVKHAAWRVMHYNVLPEWLRDNDYLVYHHRPPMPSFKKCFKSIFRIHTETGNIWTHLIGMLIFIGLMIYFLVVSLLQALSWQEIVVYMAFFLGAILCLGFSAFFHTCCCHSVAVSKVCSKLDYSGITLLIVGSFVPWLYYGFYCETITRSVYFASICILGAISLLFAMKDKFGSPSYRPIRAILFVALGLSALVPALHYVISNSVSHAIEAGAFLWMLLMGALYIGGAALYALRIPERFFPGKCDVWFHSHQFFHVLVVAAAMVHYHGLNTMQAYRESVGDECEAGDYMTEVMTTLGGTTTT